MRNRIFKVFYRFSCSDQVDSLEKSKLIISASSRFEAKCKVREFLMNNSSIKAFSIYLIKDFTRQFAESNYDKT